MLGLNGVSWLGVGVGVVVAQAYLTLWFAVIFARPWAEAYGVTDPKEHTRDVPGYTYALGAACALLLNLGLAMLHAALAIENVGDALLLGVYLAACFAVATALPGYAFLRRWNAGLLAMGSQATLILVLSAVHALL